MAKGKWKTTERLVNAAVEILEFEHPMTIRQLFYRLVSVGKIENHFKDYKRVSREMTKAREDGQVLFEWIVDRTRPTYAPSTFSNLEEYGEAIQSSYRRNNWQDQSHHVEIWVEKDAVVGSINELSEEYAITVRAIRGFSSTTAAHDISKLFAQIEKRILVLYLGDHDPSGQDIERDIYDRVCCEATGPFEIKRLAIHAADIRKFNLPPLLVKEKDTRSKAFIRQHGNDCVELDALPPDELRRRIRETVESVIDRQAWDRAVLLEESQRETTKRFAETLRSLPPFEGSHP